MINYDYDYDKLSHIMLKIKRIFFRCYFINYHLLLFIIIFIILTLFCSGSHSQLNLQEIQGLLHVPYKQ